MKMLVRLGYIASVVTLLAAAAAAQSAATAELHVTVKDPKGAVVRNATVAVRNEAQNFERSTTSNVNGEYQFLSLPPGRYAVSVEAAGFAKIVAQNVTVTVGQVAELPVMLQVAAASETVSVSAEAELVETQRTSTTTTINQERIENLPINGRNYINFALTDSQVERDIAPSIGAAPTSGLNFSGQRARANLVNVDGADAVDNSVNGIRSTVSQEGVQEFQIVNNSYAPEYGRASGGVVNIITKSGSNQFHGDVFGYLRNRNLQATNPFSFNAAGKVSDPAYTRVQAGTAFGGPIVKDKTFYYFSFETTRRHETGFSNIGANNFGLVPFDTSRVGMSFGTLDLTPDQIGFLTNPSVLQLEQASLPFAQAVGRYAAAAGAASGVALNGVVPQTIPLLGGLPLFPSSGALLPASFVPMNSLIGNYPIFEGTSLYSLRLDHKISSNQQLMLRGGVSPSTTTGIQVNAQGPQNFGQNAFSRTSQQTYRDVSISAHDMLTIGNNKVNDFLFAYSRRGLLYNFSSGPGGGNVAVNIPGFAFFGREPFSFVNRTEQRYQVSDSLSWAKGNHNMKFGIDANYLPLQADFTVNFGGVYNFGGVGLPGLPTIPGIPNFPGMSPIQAYGLGLPQNFIQGVGNPHDAFTNTPLGGFIQDSWRALPNLTLNYGVRYDVELTPTFAAINSFSQAAQKSLGITQGIPRDWDNVAPRVGLAWDPANNGKTVVRASYGMFFDHPLLALAFDSDVADGAQAPQVVLFGSSPCSVTAPLTNASPLNLNAANTFQGTLGNPNCTPLGLAQALNFVPNQQRFNATPNAPSAFVGQKYLAAGIPLILQPFGFPTAANFQYPYSNQANLTVERDLGHNFALSLQYNFNAGKRLNRPINANAVRSDLLIRNWQLAEMAGDSGAQLSVSGGSAPLFVGSVPGTLPCGTFNGQPWVNSALVSFFRPSGINPSLARALIASGGGACVTLAQGLLAAEGLNAACDPLSLSGCIPFSDMPANFSNGSSVYHGFSANLRKRFSSHYEFLVSYTYSHAIDDSVDLESPLSPQDNYNPSGDRSTSLFDQRHRFVFSGVYQTGKLSGGFWSKLGSDWTFAPIIEAGAGRPFNIITGSDRNFDFGTTTDRPLAVPGGTPQNLCGDQAVPSKFSPTGWLQPACFLNGTLIGNLSRNAGVRPSTLFTDMRVARHIGFGERVGMDAMVDVFNFINRFNVADVNPLWTNAGQATAAFDPRQLQLALKLSW